MPDCVAGDAFNIDLAGLPPGIREMFEDILEAACGGNTLLGWSIKP